MPLAAKMYGRILQRLRNDDLFGGCFLTSLQIIERVQWLNGNRADRYAGDYEQDIHRI
jgi:hypothetical protein